MAKGSARAETVEGPCVRRCKIARRVGSERAAKAWLKLSTTLWLCIFGMEVKRISCAGEIMRYRVEWCHRVSARRTGRSACAMGGEHIGGSAILWACDFVFGIAGTLTSEGGLLR